MLLSGAAFKAAFCDARSVRERKVQTCRRTTTAAAARAARVRRALRASGEQRCRRAANSPVPGRDARFECEHRFKHRPQAMRYVRCFELFDWKRI